MMLRFLTPHLQLASVLQLEVGTLQSQGRHGLLLDLDNTLKDFGAAEVPAAVRAWLQTLSAAGIRLCLVSNGRKQRIERIARSLELPFVAEAFKPFPFGCHAALKRLGLTPAQTALAGDQLFADVLAGQLAGLFTILVTPTSLEEPWFTRLKRPVERRLLRWMNGPVPHALPGDLPRPVLVLPRSEVG